MEEFTIIEQPELFSGQAQVSQEALERFKRQEAVSVKGPGIEVTTLFHEKSFVTIGEPLVFPLEPLLAVRKEKLPSDIQLQRKEYDFYVIQLACTFRAANECRFYDATFEFSLDNSGPSNVVSASRPIVYDLAPTLVEDELKVKRTYHVLPEVKLEFPAAKADISGLGYEKTSEYFVYLGRIEAYGLQQNRAGWIFRRTKQHEIGQSQRLFVIVRKHKQTDMKIRFSLAARIEAVTPFGPIGPFPLTFFFQRGNAPLDITELERQIG